jgi:hypothetical protein
MIKKPVNSNLKQQPSIYVNRQEAIEEKEEGGSSSQPVSVMKNLLSS